MSSTSRPLPPAELSVRWAAVLLGATLVSGAWLRMSMAWPSLALGANLAFGVHAHSHAAFFGWIVLAASALSARRVIWTASTARWWRWIVHVLGILSLVVLVAFGRMGYAAPTIALSALHVVLWIPLARLAWPLHRATATERAWWRWGWIALLASGVATLIPAMFVARGIRDGWWRELGIKLFLALFINGFAGLTAIGALAARGTNHELEWPAAAWARRLMAIALLPLAVLYVASTPPANWLPWIGRAAVGLMGAATMTVAVLAARQQVTISVSRPASLWTLTTIAALVVIAVLEVIAATGIGAGLLHDRSITIAFTHLVLLLTLSPLLLIALTSWRALVWRPVVATLGATTMCGALAALGWPWLGAQVGLLGLGPMSLLKLAAAGGVLAALAWFSLLPFLFSASAPETSDDVSARPANDPGVPDARRALPSLRVLSADGTAGVAPAPAHD